MGTAFPDKYEVYVYQSDLGFKGNSTTAEPGSFLEKLLSNEFPAALKAEKMAHGSPIVWTEVPDVKKKKMLKIKVIEDHTHYHK